jgi:hypothetical protein
MLGEEAGGWNGKHERSEGLHKRSAEDCGKPLAPRQGGALSEVWFPYWRASARMTFRVGVAGGNGPQRWGAEDAKRLQPGRKRPPLASTAFWFVEVWFSEQRQEWRSP